MSEWGIKAGDAITREKLKERAQALVKELMFWNLVMTSNPRMRKALENIIVLRLEIQEELEILVPGWSEVSDDA